MVLLLILVTLVLLALLVILVLLSNTPTKDSKKTKKTNIYTPPFITKRYYQLHPYKGIYDLFRAIHSYRAKQNKLDALELRMRQILQHYVLIAANSG